MSNNNKIKPKGRPKTNSFRKLSKSVTVKFSKPDYDHLCLRSRQANRTLAEYIRDSAFNAQIATKHSPEEATTPMLSRLALFLPFFKVIPEILHYFCKK